MQRKFDQDLEQQQIQISVEQQLKELSDDNNLIIQNAYIQELENDSQLKKIDILQNNQNNQQFNKLNLSNNCLQEYENKNINESDLVEENKLNNQINQIDNIGVNFNNNDSHQQHSENNGSQVESGTSPINHNEIVIKNKRRTREQSTNDRNYTCGCGKSYLSYPALYLHLKNKHNGKPPNGTLLPSVQVKKQKGKENSNENQQQYSNNYNSNSNINVVINNNDEDDRKSLEDVIECLKNIHSSYVLEQTNNLINNSVIANLIDIYYQIDKSDVVLKDQFVDVLKDKTKLIDIQKIHINDNNTLEINQTSINKMFCLFLYQIAKFVDGSIFQEISFFVELYRCVLNQEGYKYLQSDEQKNNYNNQVEYCQSNNAGQILECANVLITDYFIKHLESKDQHHFKLFGKTLDQMKNAIQFTQSFSKWLYKNRFTNSKLIMSSDP